MPGDFGGVFVVVIGDVFERTLALELDGDQVVEILDRHRGVPEAVSGAGDAHAHLARLVGQGGAAWDVVNGVGGWHGSG
ncbi:MAG: hypothetical protein K1X78_16060 [Verrucomicrobiaceae bacterium]|nr:hypothetical protein [Verrucomicrobiaceae bacterium]